MTPELRRFMTSDIHRFATSRLRRFMILDFHRFATSRLRRFMIPDLHRFMISRLRGFMSLDLHRFNHPKTDNIFTRRSLIRMSFSNITWKLISWISANPTFRGWQVLTPKIGSGKGLTCGPSFVTKYHSAGKISSKDLVKMLAVGNTPSFGKRTVCACKRKFSGMHCRCGMRSRH
jgi:hypothetical protein